MEGSAAVLAQARAVAHGRDPACGKPLRSGESLVLFGRLARRALEDGWTHHDVALASDVPTSVVAALADCESSNSSHGWSRS